MSNLRRQVYSNRDCNALERRVCAFGYSDQDALHHAFALAVAPNIDFSCSNPGKHREAKEPNNWRFLSLRLQAHPCYSRGDKQQKRNNTAFSKPSRRWWQKSMSETIEKDIRLICCWSFLTVVMQREALFLLNARIT